MKHIPIISVFLIVVTACAGHHDDSTSITDDPYDNILYIPDTTVKSDCLVLLNPGNNDLDLHGRAGILKALQARLRLHKIAIPIRIIFGEKQMSVLRKRLIKINRLDSLTMILPERSSMDIKSKLKTHRPVTVLIDSVRRMVITGDICSPSYEAAVFLIKNMPYRYSLVGDERSNLDRFYISASKSESLPQAVNDSLKAIGVSFNPSKKDGRTVERLSTNAPVLLSLFDSRTVGQYNFCLTVLLLFSCPFFDQSTVAQLSTGATVLLSILRCG